jgi:hypothetical protein
MTAFLYILAAIAGVALLITAAAVYALYRSTAEMADRLMARSLPEYKAFAERPKAAPVAAEPEPVEPDEEPLYTADEIDDLHHSVEQGVTKFL